MWICPTCERTFGKTNQSHMCVVKTIDDIFMGVADPIVLAFDAIFQVVMTWDPISAGATVKAVVFTNYKAWLVIRPMKKVLDVKFYTDEPVDSDVFAKVTEYKGKYAHHIRVADESEVTEEIIDLLRIGWEYGMKA